MSRVATASQMKGVKRAPTRDLPASGTISRRLYDLLYEHRGAIVPESQWKAMLAESGHSKAHRRGIKDLEDFYGCDIRRGGYRRWSLVGEWHGRAYVDYIAERL